MRVRDLSSADHRIFTPADLILGRRVLTLDRTVANSVKNSVKNSVVLASAEKLFAILAPPFGC